MNNRLKTLVAGAVLTVVGVVGLAFPVNVGAEVTCPQGSAVSSAPTIAQCGVNNIDPQADDPTSLTDVIQAIINVVIMVIGIIAVVMVILGGIKYSTSQGAADKVKSAKDTIMYGIIGLVVAILAFAIVNFVMDGVFGA